MTIKTAIVHDEQFVKDLYKIFNADPGGFERRKIYITPSYAYYNTISVVIIQLEGSAPKTSIFYDLCQHTMWVRLFGEKYKKVQYYDHYQSVGMGKGKSRNVRLNHLIMDLLKKHGFDVDEIERRA